MEQAARSAEERARAHAATASREAIVLSGWLAGCLSGYYAGADRRIVLPGVV